ncbi:hypothetical protein AMAG_20447 [Allomyces macrogynus ATCC 38327]|uniref:FAD-binding 8 domain-containing protein n=1 Tax=Allomyces macrogynus (strain ATCC 38327) TaxID=578462 RepID=A0A0L0TB44_ALLM3|nr:hypothetical protein AMAG_20447 [Allomyces macrogynus ATCC 38327]|eukprot:KNE71799.1 hypothetical protein AMAG_20447 [Allomyces macrogynus ATCC 38327]
MRAPRAVRNLLVFAPPIPRPHRRTLPARRVLLCQVGHRQVQHWWLWKYIVSAATLYLIERGCSQDSMYVWLNVPSVEPCQWRLFTLTSAPRDDAYYSVHMRFVRDWTRSVAQACGVSLAVGEGRRFDPDLARNFLYSSKLVVRTRL